MNELEKRLAALEKENRAKEIARLASQHALPDKVAELIQGATNEELAAHAKDLADALHPPTAPPTENGAQKADWGKSEATQKADFSFSVPGGVKW
jgi:hypothetical protein